MQARRPSAVPPLAIVLPHPPLPRRRSSLLSSASPRTPRNSCGSPPSAFSYNPTSYRKSGDSWNSSNQDEQEWEWTLDQTLLLTRTLDALPAHLLTPFHGSIPPSNLVDKIARGVVQAKGPLEWPHSVRATRVKILELARARAKEERIAAEDVHEVLQTSNINTTAASRSTPKKRPLHRQSSMDFMNGANSSLKDNENISRLSKRLQRADRVINEAPHNPYSHSYRKPIIASTIDPSNCGTRSPPPVLSFLRTSSPSCTSLSMASSTGISSSDGSSMSSVRMRSTQRVGRSESFGGPAHSGDIGRLGLKRAPSYGSSSDTSVSDDDSIRKQVKRARVKSASSPVPPPKKKVLKGGSTSSKSTMSDISLSSVPSSTTQATTVSRASDTPRPAPRAPRANLQRNPSILGPELSTAVPAQPPAVVQRSPPSTPQKRQQRPLRRMRATSFARAPARRISFGSLTTNPIIESDKAVHSSSAPGGDNALGDAFQLR